MNTAIIRNGTFFAFGDQLDTADACCSFVSYFVFKRVKECKIMKDVFAREAG